MKKCVTVILIMVVLCGWIVTSYADFLYQRVTIVDSVEYSEEDMLWIVSCRDKDGDIWSFYDDEGGHRKGNIYILLMNKVDNNSKHDEVVGIWLEIRIKDRRTCAYSFIFGCITSKNMC